MASVEASCVALLRSAIPEVVPVALAATAPGVGRLLWTAGTMPDGTPVTEHTQMYAASVTKQFVATLLGGAVLAQQVDPDGSVRPILPHLPPWAARVHVRHLVHHVSGLPSTPRILAALRLGEEADLDNEAVVRALSQLADPEDVPGRVFAYSNAGYVVLAEILRATTGADPAALARAHLFTPIGMTLTALGGAPPYGLPSPMPRTVGDGGLWTTAPDLLRWLDAFNHGLLGEELTRLLQTPGRLDDGTALDYAWGITARKTHTGMTYTHGGSWPGWAAKTVRNPTAGTALALLTCHDDADAVSALAMALHEQLLGGPSAGIRLP